MIRKIFKAFRNFYFYAYKMELIKGIARGWFPVLIKYPVYPKPRYGYNGKKPHSHLAEIINKGKNTYQSQLTVMKQYEKYLLKIQNNPSDDVEQPYWNNPWFSGLDAVALYGFVANIKPNLYLEIGSGNSTKFVRRAISDHKLSSKIVSIDPHPREEIDSLSDEIIRLPLEETDLSRFDQLTQNDILFFDGSHRCFMNSDVTIFFLEVLPKLPPGILIHIHDIHLPYDYPPDRALLYESEQYLLAAMLLGDCTKYEIVLPNKFILDDESLSGTLNTLWNQGIPKNGVSFWIKKK